MRVVTGVPFTATAGFVGADGEPATTAGPVTVHVVASDGTDVIAAGTAATAAGTDWSVPIPAQLRPDVLTAAWSDGGVERTTTRVEVVRRRLVSLADARTREAVLSDAGRFPTGVLAAVRDEVEDECEEITGIGWSGRYTVEQVVPCGDLLLVSRWAPRTVRSITVDGVPVGQDVLARLVVSEWAGIRDPDGWVDVAGWGGQVVVGYEHGPDAVPSDLVRAAIHRLKDRAVASSSAIPDRATSFSVAEGGTYRLSTAGADRTGLPDVDAVYHRYRRQVVGIA